MKGQKGFSLIETLVALAILSFISLGFLSSIATSSTARVTADDRSSGKILAETLMEVIKKTAYEPSYDLAVPTEFTGFTANVSVIENNNIQDITVYVQRRDREVYNLEGYKVNRD
jgi:prepilin-type N-terminal cleavage/methylation domain-containing protein